MHQSLLHEKIPDASHAPRMYSELAAWWPLLSPPAEYEEEAAFYQRTLLDACEQPPTSLLELGSGGGNNASFLKQRFQSVLVDLSPDMLEVSRRLNPECEHVVGDMRTVRLGRQFDCVFVHDAVMYMKSEAELRQAVETAFLHCAPGGAALFAPDFLRETFRSTTSCGGSDGEDRALRYMEWAWDPDPSDTTYLVEYVYALRDGGDAVEVLHEQHVEGLFSRSDWLRLLMEAGFQPEVVPCDLSDLEPGTLEVFIARKPSATIDAENRSSTPPA
jgi:trans-aconitate methyltransferase